MLAAGAAAQPIRAPQGEVECRVHADTAAPPFPKRAPQGFGPVNFAMTATVPPPGTPSRARREKHSLKYSTPSLRATSRHISACGSLEKKATSQSERQASLAIH